VTASKSAIFRQRVCCYMLWLCQKVSMNPCNNDRLYLIKEHFSGTRSTDRRVQVCRRRVRRRRVSLRVYQQQSVPIDRSREELLQTGGTQTELLMTGLSRRRETSTQYAVASSYTAKLKVCGVHPPSRSSQSFLHKSLAILHPKILSKLDTNPPSRIIAHHQFAST